MNVWAVAGPTVHGCAQLRNVRALGSIGAWREWGRELRPNRWGWPPFSMWTVSRWPAPIATGPPACPTPPALHGSASLCLLVLLRLPRTPVLPLCGVSPCVRRASRTLPFAACRSRRGFAQRGVPFGRAVRGASTMGEQPAANGVFSARSACPSTSCGPSPSAPRCASCPSTGRPCSTSRTRCRT